MKLYGYFRSSAVYRVRIALGLKGLDFDNVFVHLRRGDHLAPAYGQVNPQRLIPALADGTHVLTQSLAIIEYLDEAYPEPPLLPPDAVHRARVRALALAVACDIHPLNNLRVLGYLAETLGIDQAGRDAWYHHWITEGFNGIEGLLAESPLTGTYCHGEAPGLADVCLVPQVGNARRFGLDLSPWPTILRIEEACQRLPAFDRARPENQPDAA